MEEFYDNRSVQEILAEVLAWPTRDHSASLARIFPPHELLTAAQVCGLVRLVNVVDFKSNIWMRSYTMNRGVALHTWLYHILGGASKQLIQPPHAKDSNATKWSSNLRAELSLFDKSYRQDLKVLQKARKRAVDRGSDCSDIDARIQKMRSRVMVKLMEQLHGDHGSALLSRGAASGAPGGDGGPSPTSSAVAQDEHTARLLAFAMGTHIRLGEGYAFRDGPCAVQILAGSLDLLRHIASHVRGLPPRKLQPPPAEVFRLRQHLWQVECERHAERSASEAWQLTLESERREWERERKRLQSVIEYLHKEMREKVLKAEEREAELRRASETAMKELRENLKAVASQMGCAERAHRKELNFNEAEWRETLKRHEEEAVNRLRAQDAELKEYQIQMYIERNEARERAADLDERAQELTAALERLRNTSKNDLLTQVAQLKERVRALGERRKSHQRKISDANLAHRRAKIAMSQLNIQRKELSEFWAGERLDLADEFPKLKAQLDRVKSQLEAVTTELTAEREKVKHLRSIVEPDVTYFKQKGKSHAFTAAVDLAIIEALCVGVARNKVPALFIIFARFFRVKIPGREIPVPGKWVDGKRTTATKYVLYIPSETHVKETAGVLNQLHKLQVGQWLLEYVESDTETSCCYVADAAESQQRDFISQMLARRIDGKLELMSLDLTQLKGKSAQAQADAFHQSLEEVVALMEKAGMVDTRAAELLRRFLPTCTMNDRASTARSASRIILGLDPDAAGRRDNDPTCAEHALVNILEAGRQAMDAVLRDMMNITQEQAEVDANKIKAMRTCVGWFSSPACALIYQVAKYVALCSTKGYAIGQKFLEWMEARLADVTEQDEELLGHSEDMLAICGSRSYVFFIDAAVTERLVSQEGSLLTYLQEEADLGAEGGGKLRASILTGAGSEPCMSALRAMAIIADSVLWKLLKAIKPSAEKHVLDVLPVVWPTAVSFFQQAATDPASVAEGSLSMGVLGAEQVGSATPGQARRSQRARLDMLRIRAKAVGDPLIEKLLCSAFKAMEEATKNHAEEWLPGGKLCAEAITPALRARYDALISTSTCVERVHAVGRDVDQRGKWQRPDTRAGLVQGKLDKTDKYATKLGLGELQRQLNICRPQATAERKRTLKAMLIAQGRAKRAERDAKLEGVKAKRAAKAAEQQRLRMLPLATKYSELKNMSNADLADQLKAHKLIHKKTGFTVTQRNREAYVVQLQNLLGASANDLETGDPGTDPVGVVRKRKQRASTHGGGTGRRKKKAKLSNDYGDEWDEDEEFDAIILGSKISAGVKEDGHKKGTRLFHISWPGYSADAATWEPEVNLGAALIEEWEASLEAEAQLDAEEEYELEHEGD